MADQLSHNDDLIRRIQRETNVEILPGTEVMADIAGAHFIHADNSTKSTVLVPQPTDDPHDPLVRVRLFCYLMSMLTSHTELESLVETSSYNQPRLLRRYQHYSRLINCSLGSNF